MERKKIETLDLKQHPMAVGDNYIEPSVYHYIISSIPLEKLSVNNLNDEKPTIHDELKTRFIELQELINKQDEEIKKKVVELCIF